MKFGDKRQKKKKSQGAGGGGTKRATGKKMQERMEPVDTHVCYTNTHRMV